ncbi:MAG: hypothetical protein WAM82_23000 [Thermoanaerobaculia bacterium]
MLNLELDAILFERTPGCWVGQCLQYDIGAQAESLPDLAYQLGRAIAGYAVICEETGVEPFTALGSAPREYWDLWRRATLTVVSQQEPRFRLPKAVSVPETRMKVAESEKKKAA